MPTPLSAEIKAARRSPELRPPGHPHAGRLAQQQPRCSGWAARGIASSSAPARAQLKGRNSQRDPRVALSIVDFHNPYEEAQLRGRVVEHRPDPELKIMDPISHKYIGKPFPMQRVRGARGAGDRGGQGALHQAALRAHAAAAVALGQRQRLLRPHQHQRLDRVHPVLARPQHDRRRAHAEADAGLGVGPARGLIAQRPRRGHQPASHLDDRRVAPCRAARGVRSTMPSPWLSWIAWSCTPKPGMPQNMRVRWTSQLIQ